jgi:hypothetical protein
MRSLLPLLLLLAACPGDRTKTPPPGPGDDDPADAIDARPGETSGAEPILPPPAEGASDPVVACDEAAPHLAPVEPRDWPAEQGWARVDEIVFRVGCLSRSLLENHLAALEKEIVACFAERAEDATTTLVVRSEWVAVDYTSQVTRTELRGLDDDPLRACLEAVLARLAWRAPEREQRTVVDIEVTRGFFPEEAGGATGRPR